MKVKTRSILVLILGIFLAICILFPNDIFNLKKILFVLIIAFNIKVIGYELSKNRIILFYGIFFPILIIISSVLLSGDIIAPFLKGFCTFFILIYCVTVYYDIDYESIFFSIVPIIALVTIGICLLDLVGIVGVYQSSPIREFIYKHEIGVMGLDGVFLYKVFMKTSPLLTIYIFYCFEKRKLFGFVISVLTLGLSGARANIAFTFVVFTVFYFFSYRGSGVFNVFVKILLVSIILSYIYFNFNDLIFKFQNLFIENSKVSDLTRVGHWIGLKEYWNQHPFKMILGSGLGSSYYSYGTNSFVNSIELPYLDLYRQIGLVPFAAFMWFIIYPLVHIKGYAWLKAGYISYLLIAATNPLLFNSTAYVVYTLMYLYLYKSQNQMITHNL